MKSCDIVYDGENEMVTFRFTNPLPVGTAQLELTFTGELNDKMKGFYRSKSIAPSGEETYIAVTQFEVQYKLCIFFVIKVSQFYSFPVSSMDCCILSI